MRVTSILLLLLKRNICVVYIGHDVSSCNRKKGETIAFHIWNVNFETKYKYNSPLTQILFPDYLHVKLHFFSVHHFFFSHLHIDIRRALALALALNAYIYCCVTRMLKQLMMTVRYLIRPNNAHHENEQFQNVNSTRICAKTTFHQKN